MPAPPMPRNRAFLDMMKKHYESLSSIDWRITAVYNAQHTQGAEHWPALMRVTFASHNSGVSGPFNVELQHYGNMIRDGVLLDLYQQRAIAAKLITDHEFEVPDAPNQLRLNPR